MIYIFVLGLLTASLVHPAERRHIGRRSLEDSMIDASSLLVHFLLIPLVQAAVVYKAFSIVIPGLKGSVPLGWGLAILANMLIDYGWYWNHRLLHAQSPLWNLHKVHHASGHLDVLATPRNSAVSPLFMVYFWAQPLAIYLARDPVPFLAVAGFGLFVNFWGHTGLNLPRNSLLRKIASLAIIQPEDHFWHHSAKNSYCNFATVFNFWDKLHGTWHQPNEAPGELGYELKLPVWKKILLPVESAS
jgi:sterol desaturase/sphingolipid hydroxylase (fatty acid hydroxylase superfamily)